MRGWAVAVALLGGLSPPFVGWMLVECADSLGSRIGRAVASFASWGTNPSEPPSSFVAPDPDVLAANEAIDPRTRSVALPSGVAAEARGRATRPGSSSVPTRGIRVRADTVLRLANAGLRPQGYPVPATNWRPAGIALSGVGALGIGLQDGDVLTRAAGRPALEPGDVIGVVIASRGAKVPEISGRFWRNGEPWNLVVEQPYLHPCPRAAEPAADPELTRTQARPASRKDRAPRSSDRRHGPKVGAASRAQPSLRRAQG